jgi:hypothetical protein
MRNRTRKSNMRKRRQTKRHRGSGLNPYAPNFIPSNNVQLPTKVNWGIKKPLLLNTSVPQNITVPKHVKNIWVPELNQPTKPDWNVKFPVLDLNSQYTRLPKKIKNIWK